MEENQGDGGRWEMENGRWKMGDGRWEMRNGRCPPADLPAPLVPNVLVSG